MSIVKALVLILFIHFSVICQSSVILQQPVVNAPPKIVVSQLTAPESLYPYISEAIDSSETGAHRNFSSLPYKVIPANAYYSIIALKDTRYAHCYKFDLYNDKPDTASLFVYIDPQKL